LDDDRRRALRDLRFFGEAVLTRLGHTRLISQITYKLEPRFQKVLGCCIIQPGKPAIIKVQYPLWNHLTEEERFELVAHEHSHFAAWREWGHGIDPHGIEWQSMMRCLGYQNVSGSKDLGHAARQHLAERGKIMATSNKATLWVKDGYIFVKTPYVEAFIQELKADIPYGSRVFLKVEKVWRVDAAYHEDLLSVVKKHFGEPTILEPEVKEVVVVEGASKDPFGAMLRVAPAEVLKKVYRMIASEIHPDRGGKPEDMVTLNQAWDAIKKERGL
jgi:hypothetical protein